MSAALPAAAQGLPSDIVHATLLEGWRTEAGTQMAALRLDLAPGWKTYWRAPGEGGIPPHFDWNGSENVGGVTFHWPKPEVFDLNGLRIIGYLHELVLPIEIRPADANRPVSVTARIDLGVCEEICVPVTVDVAADLGRTAKPDPVILASLGRMPEEGRKAGLSASRCAAEPIRDGLRLTSLLTLPQVGPDEFAVVELADQSIWVSQADTRRSGEDLSATADLVPSDAKPFALDRSTVRITVFGGSGRVVEVQGCTG
ncbi:protein-disulfide reductase DsbD domain-containing protein [Defluviimonas sp. SAOS-178_SWC]|uniref:protein-disulfide reductase DsbD domain-containing protein n=1 Tax=Defluviimonas sp. SAOS-178_SWC TaxID=3121287 RepID=UPI003221E5D4